VEHAYGVGVRAVVSVVSFFLSFSSSCLLFVLGSTRYIARWDEIWAPVSVVLGSNSDAYNASFEMGDVVRPSSLCWRSVLRRHQPSDV
jgi:hypothetical protein